MSPVRSLRNQYQGVNAHLHSLWQSGEGWYHFHNRHVEDIAGLLHQQLLPLGCTAMIEEERPYPAVAIYELGDTRHSMPIAWIELLAPLTKGREKDAQTYVARRRVLLESGLVFVEIDYLHETPPTFPSLPDYSDLQNRLPEAHPYRIVVLDPRTPDLTSAEQPTEFDVDQPIPRMTLPLTHENSLSFDFGACYRKTFEDMAYGLELVDYAQLPLNFERYSPADQTRIAARMLAVIEAAHGGIDLEGNALPVREMSLEEALAQIKRMGEQ